MNPLRELIRAVERADVGTVSAIVRADPSLVKQPVAALTKYGHGTLLHLAMPGDGRDLLPAHVEIAAILLQHGAPVDAIGHGPNHGDCPALTLAAWGGHVPLVKLLLAHGAEPNGGPSKQPLRTAARHGHKDAVEALIHAGADYDFLDLLVAGMTDRVIAHLDRHPDQINTPLRNGSPPLHGALDREMQNGSGLASLLLERGADSLLRDARGRLALHIAIQLDNKEAIDVLRSRSGDLDVFAAAGLSDVDTVRRLVFADLSCANAAQADGVTPLFFAAHSGSVECARILLEAGARPSPGSDRFWACLTPLHLAIQRGHVDVVRLLLNHGADANACGADRDRFQPSPLDVAAWWGGPGVVQLLRDHGAR